MSAAEIVAHSVMLELAVLGGADPLTQKLPKPIRLLERWRLAIRFEEMSWIGRKSPIPLVAAILSAKKEMPRQLRNARERTLAFLYEAQKRDLSA